MNVASTSLYFNVASLVLSFIMILQSYKRRKTIPLIYWGLFTFLVVGQAVNISFNVNSYYLNNYITAGGQDLASLLVFFMVLTMSLIGTVLHRSEPLDLRGSHGERVGSMANGRLVGKRPGYTSMNLLIFIGISFLLIHVVGFSAWLHSSRPDATGSTLLIIAMGSTTYPLLIKLASDIKTTWRDWLLYTLSVLMMLTFTRIYAIFHILILVTIIIYKRRQFRQTRNNKRGQFLVLFLGVLIFVMFFGYGAYRDAMGILGSHATPSQVISYIESNPSNSLLSLNRNYRIGIEGMSGFAGEMSAVVNSGNWPADWGVPLLAVLFQFVPGVFRSSFSGIIDYLNSLNWYPYSVVPAGLQSFGEYFSFGSVILYPLCFLWFAYSLERRLMNNVASNRLVNTKFLVYAIISIYGLQIIRGSIADLVFYTISELVVMYFSVFMFKVSHVQKCMPNVGYKRNDAKDKFVS